jgi:hypothetical protein
MRNRDQALQQKCNEATLQDGQAHHIDVSHLDCVANPGM